MGLGAAEGVATVATVGAEAVDEATVATVGAEAVGEATAATVGPVVAVGVAEVPQARTNSSNTNTRSEDSSLGRINFNMGFLQCFSPSYGSLLRVPSYPCFRSGQRDSVGFWLKAHS